MLVCTRPALRLVLYKHPAVIVDTPLPYLYCVENFFSLYAVAQFAAHLFTIHIAMSKNKSLWRSDDDEWIERGSYHDINRRYSRRMHRSRSRHRRHSPASNMHVYNRQSSPYLIRRRATDIIDRSEAIDHDLALSRHPKDWKSSHHYGPI